MKIILTALAALCLSPAAFAQSPSVKGVLRVHEGSVMVLRNGSYEKAATSEDVQEGESVMLQDGARATVSFEACEETLRGPNTFVLEKKTCPKTAVLPASSRAAVGMVAGAALMGAAILDGLKDKAPEPLSAGPRENR